MNKQEAIIKLQNILNDDIYSWTDNIEKAFRMAIDSLQKSASIKPERERGKWVTHKESHKNMCYYIKCSKCGKEAIWTNGFSLYPPIFCPNCGADMRGE